MHWQDNKISLRSVSETRRVVYKLGVDQRGAAAQLGSSTIFDRFRESSGTLRRAAAHGSPLISRILSATGVGASSRA